MIVNVFESPDETVIELSMAADEDVDVALEVISEILSGELFELDDEEPVSAIEPDEAMRTEMTDDEILEQVHILLGQLKK